MKLHTTAVMLALLVLQGVWLCPESAIAQKRIEQRITEPGAPGRAVIKAPAGAYQLGAVCSRGDLAKLGLSGAQLQVPAAIGKRSFSFKVEDAIQSIDRREIGRTTVGYEVK